MKVIIIGGVAGGATTAARLRRLNENIQITIYEKSGYISYANCGLPYFIGDVITSKSALTLQTPESFKDRFNIDVFVNHEVISINRKKKEIVIKDLLNNKEIIDTYDKLVIATGANPIIPNIEGKELGLTLKNIEDAYKMYDYIKENNVKDALVIGGGFIGLEVIENLRNKNINVTLIEKGSQVLPQVDVELIPIVHEELIKNNVKLKFNKEIAGLFKENGKIVAKFIDKETIKTDMVVFAIGVLPASKLAADCGLVLGIKSSIKVNRYLRTSCKNVYACGDVISIKNLLTENYECIPLAGPANKQARVVANNLAGIKEEYKGTIGTSIIKVFDNVVGFTGLNERQAKGLGYNYDKIYISPNNHASYYPSSEILNMKVMFDKDTYKVLGAQIIGKDGVDKKIDILSFAIFNNISLFDLKDIDFAYAPPFNSAKDPINMISFVLDNLKNNIVNQFFMEDIPNLSKDKNVLFLDVRTVKEYKKCHIKNSVNIPVDELRKRISEVDKTKEIYLICLSGVRSYIASRILSAYGCTSYNLSGGFRLVELNKEKYLSYLESE